VLVVVAVWSVVARCAGSSCVKTQSSKESKETEEVGLGMISGVLGVWTKWGLFGV